MFDRKDKSYDKDSLQTPQYLFNFAESLLPTGRKFDIDLAASHDHHLVKDYITKETSDETYNWACYGFCNPPYSRGMVDKFVRRAIFEASVGFTTIMVIPELNGEARSLLIMNNASRIIHFDQRVNFINPLTGKEVVGNNRGTIVVEFTPNPSRTKHICCSLQATKETYK